MSDESARLLEEQAPAISSARAKVILEEHYGLRAEVLDLPSERDRNFFAVVNGERHAVLKVSSSAEDESVVAMENAAMAHVARVAPELPVPRIFSSKHGGTIARAEGDDGRRHLVRLVSVVPGTRAEGRRISRPLAADIGAMTARVSDALHGFFHGAGGRAIDWDVRRVPTLAKHAANVADAGKRGLVETALGRIAPALARLDALPAHIQHADVTLTNVLLDDERITGVVDFGDMHHTASVCDLVAAFTSVLRSVADQPDEVLPTASAFLDGYQRVRMLEVGEGEVLGDLVLARLLTTVLISAWRAGLHPDNTDYIVQYDDSSWSLLRQLVALDSVAPWSRLVGTARVTRVTLETNAGDLHARRRAVLGGDLSPLFYRRPIRVARAEGPWLFDESGARYLDGYNNVPVLGHAHPAVNQAVARQQALVHANSRYLHPNAVELAERLVATMPAELDTCIFVSSGTEAVDLAWSMAAELTGRSGAVIVDWAYHGVSHAVRAFTSNEWPAGYRPEHVATFPAPARDANGADARERVQRATVDLETRGHSPALVMVDPMFTSAGIFDATPSFMKGVVTAARDAGALFLADEVQSGFGRTGPSLWSFVAAGIVPDFVTLGKPMGNGHPMAAVITRRAIADAFARKREHFSTFAGGPVACAAALTVLDVLGAQGLPAQAVRVGHYLREEVRRLLAASNLSKSIVDVRGTGLIAGIEVDAGSPERSRARARAIVEALRDRCVLIGTTGRWGQVLKVRPPLVWTEREADVFVAALREVLSAVV